MFSKTLLNGSSYIEFKGMVANPDIYTRTNRDISRKIKKGEMKEHPIYDFTDNYFYNVSSWLLFLYLLNNKINDDITEINQNGKHYLTFGDNTLAVKYIMDLDGENFSNPQEYCNEEYGITQKEKIKEFGADESADYTCYFLFVPHKKETFSKIKALQGKGFDINRDYHTPFINIAKASKDNIDMFFFGVLDKENTYFAPKELINNLFFSSMKAPQA